MFYLLSRDLERARHMPWKKALPRDGRWDSVLRLWPQLWEHGAGLSCFYALLILSGSAGWSRHPSAQPAWALRCVLAAPWAQLFPEVLKCHCERQQTLCDTPQSAARLLHPCSEEKSPQGNFAKLHNETPPQTDGKTTSHRPQELIPTDRTLNFMSTYTDFCLGRLLLCSLRMRWSSVLVKKRRGGPEGCPGCWRDLVENAHPASGRGFIEPVLRWGDFCASHRQPQSFRQQPAPVSSAKKIKERNPSISYYCMKP